MIQIKDLHDRGFFEIGYSNQTKDSLMIFTNFVHGCVLYQNGDGYIPYINMSLISKIQDGTPCKMTVDITILDELISMLKTC